MSRGGTFINSRFNEEFKPIFDVYIRGSDSNLDLVEDILKILPEENNFLEKYPDYIIEGIIAEDRRLVRLLLDYGADPDSIDSDKKQLASTHAIRIPRTSILRMLIAEGADLDSQDGQGDTTLHHAIKDKVAEDMFDLVLENTGNINILNKDGMSPLIVAARVNSDISIFRKLIPRRANVNQQDKVGNTALHYAIGNKNYNIVQLLINNRANVNLVTRKAHLSPLHTVIGLYEKPAEETGDTLATKAALIRIIESLIRARADPNLLTDKGRHAIHLAISKKFTEAVKLLIAYDRTNLNMVLEELKQSPLIMAIDRDLFDIAIPIAAANGVELNFQDRDGSTAIHHAVLHNNIELIRVLRERGARVNIRNNAGQLPIDLTDDHNILDVLNHYDHIGTIRSRAKRGPIRSRAKRGLIRSHTRKNKSRTGKNKKSRRTLRRHIRK